MYIHPSIRFISAKIEKGIFSLFLIHLSVYTLYRHIYIQCTPLSVCFHPLYLVTDFFSKGIESVEQNQIFKGSVREHLNHKIFRTRCCKPLIFQTQITWFNRIHSLKYLRYATFGFKDIVIRKLEFVAKTQFLYLNARSGFLPCCEIENEIVNSYI